MSYSLFVCQLHIAKMHACHYRSCSNNSALLLSIQILYTHSDDLGGVGPISCLVPVCSSKSSFVSILRCLFSWVIEKQRRDDTQLKIHLYFPLLITTSRSWRFSLHAICLEWIEVNISWTIKVLSGKEFSEFIMNLFHSLTSFLFFLLILLCFLCASLVMILCWS